MKQAMSIRIRATEVLEVSHGEFEIHFFCAPADLSCVYNAIDQSDVTPDAKAMMHASMSRIAAIDLVAMHIVP